MQEIDEEHRIGDKAIELILRTGERDIDHCPSNNAGASVEEELDVDGAYPGIEFDPHVKIIEGVAAKFAVFGMGRPKMGFEVDEEGEQIAHAIPGDQEGSPVVEDNSGRE